jgi:4-hydroxybenzoate decarboxylase
MRSVARAAEIGLPGDPGCQRALYPWAHRHRIDQAAFWRLRKAVGTRVLSTPHGLGYAKLVIVVDESIDPFNLPQVMWALSTKFNPKFDLVTVPGLSVLPLDPASDPAGITDKLVIDATTPLAPENHGHYSQDVKDPVTTDEWLDRLRKMLPASGDVK